MTYLNLTKEESGNRIVRTLIVEDDDDYANLETRILSQISNPSFILSRAISLKDAKQILSKGSIDFVLLDLFLPDSFGLDTLKEIRRLFPSVPILVLTGVGSAEMGVSAIREGADDYLIKNQIRMEILPRIILYAIEKRGIEIERVRLFELEKKARLEAEHAIIVRDLFISIANHELKTPLTSLRLKIQLLEKTLSRDSVVDEASIQSAVKMMSLVDRDLERFGLLIDALMDFSQIQAGTLILKLEECNLADVIRDVVLSLRQPIVAAGCQVRVKGGAQVVGHWDRLRLEQVVANLLMNASKYAPGRIDINVEKKGDSAILEVRDYGPGISEQDLARIFHPFERAVQGQGIAGLGLGLYVIQKIVQSHGGKILVDSKLGNGTTFKVQIPTQPQAA